MDTTRAEAEARLGGFVRQLNEGPAPNLIGRDLRKMLFGHVANEWWSMQTASERTRQDYRTLLNSQVLPALGDVSIIDVTKARVQQLILEMPVAPATANKALFMVKSILDHATEEGVIPRNPARR
jgi:hypothetical protein